VGSFIILGELIRNDFVKFPLDLDELIIAFSLSVIVLIVVALLTKPNKYELRTVNRMRNIKVNQETVDLYLNKPNGLEEIKLQYKKIQLTAISISLVAIIIWSFLLVKLA